MFEDFHNYLLEARIVLVSEQLGIPTAGYEIPVSNSAEGGDKLMHIQYVQRFLV